MIESGGGKRRPMEGEGMSEAPGGLDGGAKRVEENERGIGEIKAR
jgi:hypothetical protein